MANKDQWVIGNNPNLLNPQLPKNFVMSIVGIDGLTNPFNGTELATGDEMVNIPLQNVTIPPTSTGVNAMNIENMQLKFSNHKITYGQITGTARHIPGMRNYEMFRELHRRNTDYTNGVGGEPSDYMFTVYIQGKRASGVVDKIWGYTWAFVTEVGGLTWTTDDDGVQTFDFAIDFNRELLETAE
jgi:hypothetical protein